MGDRQSRGENRQGEGRNLIERWLTPKEEQHGGGLSQWGRPPTDAHNLLRTFYLAMRKADITRFRFHDLRHTVATRFIQAGVDVYSVQKLGRWKTISMVLRYAHHQPESLRGEVPRCWIDCGEKAHNAGTIGRGSK